MSKHHSKQSTKCYQIIHPSELTAEQLQILKSVSRQRVLGRLVCLIGDGKITVSQVQANYGALMNQVGHA